MTDNWVHVYSYSEVYQAEIAKQILADNDIQAFLVNKKDSSYTSFGDVEIYVQPTNVIRAKMYLQQSEA